MIQVASTSPCGFCGRGSCSISLENKKGTHHASAPGCPYAYKFNIGSAVEGSTTNPCTNRPLHCPLCLQTQSSKVSVAIWKYNFDDHCRDTHPSFSSSDPRLSLEFRRELSISINEQIGLRIPPECRKAPIDEIVDSVEMEGSSKPHRTRTKRKHLDSDTHEPGHKRSKRA